MKKIVFTLVLLFAAPAWADVTITATQVGESNEVVIDYNSNGNLPRAFGVDITVTDGNIIACIPAMIGECTVSVRGFGIFPGTIDIAGDGTVNNYGSPAAPPGATGALGGIDTNGITIEMGSLYEEPNAPPLSGILCTIVITESCTVNIAGNAARCGVGSEAKGVVMEDPAEDVNVVYVPADVNYEPGPVDCFPSDHDDYDEWLAVGKPDSWCFERQCHGDADGAQFAGKWVFGPDLTVLIAGWNQEYSGDDELDGPDPDELPDTWIAADFDHAAFAGKRVFGPDLTVLITYWNQDVVPDDCLDVP